MRSDALEEVRELVEELKATISELDVSLARMREILENLKEERGPRTSSPRCLEATTR